MSDFATLFTFLDGLTANNSKEWMDANRPTHKSLRQFFIGWLDEMNVVLARHRPDYHHLAGKRAIMRINNNLMFHPEKPIYKSHFGADLDKVPGKTFFYIHIGQSESFVAGGQWLPEMPILSSIREAIDYDGDRLKEILAARDFVKAFDALDPDHQLKSAPKGYTRDHQHIDLLRMKSFTVTHHFTAKRCRPLIFSNKWPHATRPCSPSAPTWIRRWKCNWDLCHKC